MQANSDTHVNKIKKNKKCEQRVTMSRNAGYFYC